MYPILLHWGELVVPAWHTMFAFGAIVAFFVFSKMNERSGVLNSKDSGYLFATCYIVGYFGARIFAIFVEEQQVSGLTDLFVRISTFGAMTFYGGFLSATLAGLTFCWLKKVSAWKCADAAITAGLIALGIGRIGCFLNGDDYGLPVTGSNGIPWWAVSFPNHEDPIPRYPVQLIEAAFVFIASGIAIWLWSRKTVKRSGLVAIGLVTSYAIFRFCIEYLRGDPRGWLAHSTLSPSQVISILLLVLCNVLFFVRIYHDEKSATIVKS